MCGFVVCADGGKIIEATDKMTELSDAYMQAQSEFEMTFEQARQFLELAFGDYLEIRSQYRSFVHSAVLGYSAADKARVTKYRNDMKKAISLAFNKAADQGYIDGGGEDPQPKDFEEWLQSRVSQEWGYVETLFSGLKDAKKEDDFDAQMEANLRADRYANTLDGIYNEAKVRGAGSVMLTFGGDDGEHTCTTCASLKDKSHRASWWVNKGLIPGPVNPNYECGGFNCRHFLFDKNGRLFTIS